MRSKACGDGVTREAAFFAGPGCARRTSPSGTRKSTSRSGTPSWSALRFGRASRSNLKVPAGRPMDLSTDCSTGQLRFKLILRRKSTFKSFECMLTLCSIYIILHTFSLHSVRSRGCCIEHTYLLSSSKPSRLEYIIL